MSSRPAGSNQRQTNRELMPNVADLVDQARHFLGNVKVEWAYDEVTGYEIGTRPGYIDHE